ncbi:Bax inhibitor-1 family protein [Theobroma cacao]|uniref:Bax inhibitor-1 family protein n=1 Tax=Theobroma cacao TaxID=3641 RepID=S1S3Y9_THECC|nr:Bax inhibitor-1 family protein [Theobroma cacao]
MATDNESDDNENREKWALMFAVYAIISLQFLLAVAVGSVVVSVSRIPHFVLHTAPGLSIYIISIVLCLISSKKEMAGKSSKGAVGVSGLVIDRDFSSGELVLISFFLVACVYIPIQVFHPFAKLSTSIFACLFALSFAGRMYIAGNLFIKHKFYDPIGAAVIVHLIFLMTNPNRKELTSSRAGRVPLRNP